MYRVRPVLRLIALCVILTPMAAMHAADIPIVADGQARAVIVVPADVMAEDQRVHHSDPNYQAELDRRQLRESIRDLAHYVGVMSGAELEIAAADPADGRTPILIGAPATAKFGPPAQTDIAGQGHRFVVTPQAIGLIGESDLALSYAVITLLHDWGCRWYIPSDMGEHIPANPTLTLAEQDRSVLPVTLYRGIWYCDDAYRRRNRMGGLKLSAGHALEHTITEKQRDEHPDWRAVINGKPHPTKIKWTHPAVADAIADAILAKYEKKAEPSYSLSPMDGIGWDEELDPQSDAGDWDPVASTVSKTDRLLVLCNRVAEQVTAVHPDVLFGFLVYVDYTRPPKREKVHPALVPQIAPITYQRAHPMTHTDHPNGRQLLDLVEGWAEVIDRISYYWYGYNLAEVSAPNPFLTKWGTDLPLLMENNMAFWQPETMPNFETTAPALYMSVRYTWDQSQTPDEIYAEFFTNFYGAASEPMEAYWRHIDHAWINSGDYAGSGFGYLRIFTPEVMAKARELMDASLAACQTITEYRRVKMADDSLRNFERMMTIRTGLVTGQLANLAPLADAYRQTAMTHSREYKDQYAFAPRDLNNNWHTAYFNFQWGHAATDASRVAKEYRVAYRAPLRDWKWKLDPNMAIEGADKIKPQDRDVLGTKANWQATDFDDADWPTVDVGTHTWSAMGLHSYQGDLWYRTTAKAPAAPAGKKTYLWIPLMDGELTVYVNGQHIPYITPAGDEKPSYSSYCKPVTLDITHAVKNGQENQITIHARRAFLNELGTGGIMAPPYFMTEK